jgi:methylated-DNA-protein-cysteine methyltransferase related protein
MNQKVYDYLITIPLGKVSTYGRVAQATGIRSPRLVGKILHNNPSPDKYPCHRVVFADGSLTDGFAFGGREEQKFLLEKEGVAFIGDKVDLEHCLV